jgi:hypothetical protein
LLGFPPSLRGTKEKESPFFAKKEVVLRKANVGFQEEVTVLRKHTESWLLKGKAVGLFKKKDKTACFVKREGSVGF